MLQCFPSHVAMASTQKRLHHYWRLFVAMAMVTGRCRVISWRVTVKPGGGLSGIRHALSDNGTPWPNIIGRSKEYRQKRCFDHK